MSGTARGDTPGPWKVRQCRIGNARLEIEDASGNWIGDARPWTALRGDTKKQEANARLMAAAPEMLEALRQIIWKTSGNFGDGQRTWPATIDRNDATIQMGIAAIAKAEAAHVE